ncbi:MAG: hypothetical protein ABJC05_08880 [Pyrinomonadaceae bacterium]
MRLLHPGGRLVLLGVVIFAFTSCQLFEPTVVKSGDGRFQLTVPAGWREDPSLHERAGIRASNGRREMYVIVISEGKDRFADNMTLEGFTTITRDNMMKKVGSPQATPPHPVTVSDAYPGMQYGIQGEVDNVQVAYLVTDVETPKDFHQIITWTLRSRIDQNEITLQKVTNTFQANY